VAINRYPISSTCFSEIGYDDEEQVLYLTFAKGGTYVLEGVPQDEVDSLVAAASKGGFWNASMRGKY
jgi:hypothetical protein